MNSLSRHLLALLLRYDCVIVPDLGGFVAQYVPARYLKEEGLFLPPHRTLAFNPQLSMNDGLLVQSYMQCHHLGYAEALRMIGAEVAALKDEVDKHGQAAVNGLGVLSKQVGGSYMFTPLEAGIVSPELYALSTVSCCIASERQRQGGAEVRRPARRKAKPAAAKLKAMGRSLRESEWTHYVAAAVVAVVFYFLWATPVQNDAVLPDGHYSTSVNAQLFAPDKPMAAVSDRRADTIAVAEAPTVAAAEDSLTASHDVASAQAQKVTAGEQPAAPAAEPASVTMAEPQAPPRQQVTNDAPEAAYVIVLSSAISKHSAEAYVASLQRDGLKTARVMSTPKMVRVVCGGYASEREARQALRELSTDARFSDAWVLRQ